MLSDPETDPSPILPAHIEQTVLAIARLHNAHDRRATPLQLLVDRLTAIVARPAFVGATLLTVAVWIVANLLLRRFTGWSFDRPAFPWLQGAGVCCTLWLTHGSQAVVRNGLQSHYYRKQTLEQVTLRDESHLGMTPTSAMFAPNLTARYFV